MASNFKSTANGLDIPLTADMRATAGRFLRGEGGAKVIDDGETKINKADPSQLQSEVDRLTAKLKELEAAKETNEKPAKASKKATTVAVEVPAETEADLA